jgi:hypothetical protein
MKTINNEFLIPTTFQRLSVEQLLPIRGGDTPPSNDSPDPFKPPKTPKTQKYDEYGNKIKKNSVEING